MSIYGRRSHFFGTVFPAAFHLDGTASELAGSRHFEAVVQTHLATAHDFRNVGVNDFIFAIYYFVLTQNSPVLPAREVVLEVAVQNWIIAGHCRNILDLELGLNTTASFMHCSYLFFI